MANRLVTAAVLAASYLVYKRLGKHPGEDHASTAREVIEVNVPVRTAYNQWTQFEDLPKFMDSVLEVRQLDDRHLHWRASVLGKEEEWDAEITEQIPDELIAWRSISGAQNEGMVTFRRLSDSRTQITLRMTYRPKTMTEKVGDVFGLVQRQARSNLERFKHFIEGRGIETGAWRGTIHH